MLAGAAAANGRGVAAGGVLAVVASGFVGAKGFVDAVGEVAAGFAEAAGVVTGRLGGGAAVGRAIGDVAATLATGPRLSRFG